MGDGRTRPGTRDRILIAAASMLGEDPTTRLSVRAVAARAGTSTGSLRHFFPTQRALLDAVVAGLYDVDIPGDPIHETDRAPTERLVDCLRQVLAQVGTGERARQYWRGIHDTYIAPEVTTEDVAAFRSLERFGLHLIERWLTVLAEEGAVPREDVGAGARFLTTVLNGLFVERALPADPARLGVESETLRRAVEAVVRGGGSA